MYSLSFHILLHYNHKFKCILLGFYVKDQHSIIYNFKVFAGGGGYYMVFKIDNNNLKAVECICIQPTLLGKPQSKVHCNITTAVT